MNLSKYKSQNLTTRLLGGGSIILLLSILSAPLGYLLRILFSRNLSVGEYGLFYSVLALFSFAASYNDLGFGYSVAYLLPKFKQKKQWQKLWNTYAYDQIIEVGTSILISLLLIFTARFLSLNYFHEPAAKTLILIFTFYFVANSFVSALQKLFTGLQLPQFYSSMEPVRLLLTLSLSFLVILFEWGNLITFALTWAGAYVLVGIIYQLILQFQLNQLVKPITWDKKLFNQMLHYAVPTLMTSTVYILMRSTDTFFLTLIHGVESVGIYNIAVPLASMPMILLSPLQLLILPLISQLMETSQTKVTKLIELMLKAIPLIGLYFGVFMFSFPAASIGLLFGNKWISAASTPLMIISLGFTFNILSEFLATVTNGLGAVKLRLKAASLITTLNLITSFLGSYFFGVTGVVISNVLIYGLSVILFLLIIRKYLLIRLPLKFYIQLLSLFAALAAVLALLNLAANTWTEFISFGIIYSFVVAVGTGLLFWNELKQVAKLFG